MTDLNGAERLMSALRLVSTAEQRHAEAIARRLRMNASDLNALSFIFDRGSPTTGEVGRQLDLTSGAVTGVIDRLMKRGLVERISDPRDRRKVVVRAVAAMIVPVSNLFEPIESSMAALLARYSEQEIDSIAQFLEQAAELVLERAENLERGKA